MDKTYNTNNEMSCYDLIGLQDVKRDIGSIIKNIKYQSSNISKRNRWHLFAFVGGHGTCKKTTARAFTHELYTIGEITNDKMTIIRLSDLDIEKQKLHDKLNEFEGVLYIRDSSSLEQRFSFNTGIDTLLDDLEVHNRPITIIIECLSKHSFDTAMNRNARLYEVLNEDIINRPVDFNYWYSAEQAVDVLRVIANHTHTSQIPEISFAHPVVLNLTFERLALKVFEAIIKEKGPGAIDANTIKNFLRVCVDNFICNRTHFNEKTKLYLETENDIPESYRRYLEEPAKIQEKELCFTPNPSLTKEERIEQLKQCIVLVEAYRRNSSIPIQSTGSILTKSGYVLVANHCVANCDSFRCRVYNPGGVGGDDRWFDATKLCNTDNDFEYDQALLKMDGTNFPCIPLMGENENILAGEQLTIIGYPMGENLSDHISKLQPSVMSAKLSSIQEKHGIQRCYLGNVIGYGGMSGAPCLNDDGKLVCIVQGQVQAFDSSNPYQIQTGMMYGTTLNLAAITEKDEAKISFSNENQEDYI